jgi:tRNA pseudouridine55 synthase
MSRDARPDVTDGLTIVDKAAGMTSHDVVAKFRRLARTRRVGHAGTLDPMATGVLVLAVGRATRLLNHLELEEKGYEACIRLGQATTTDDAEGKIVSGASTAGCTEADVLDAMRPLVGNIMQVPATVSAIKVGGERAYDLVRAGESVELAARAVTVRRFDAVGFTRSGDLLDVDVVVECTSGTYVRALARDLGAALGVGAHLTALRRTKVGAFTVGRARTLEQLADENDPVMIAMPDAVRAVMDVCELTPAEVDELSYGRTLEPRGIAGTYGALNDQDEVVALLHDDKGRARPVLVFVARG